MSADYERYKRDKESKAFYSSVAWRECRRIVLERDNYLCQLCLKDKTLKPADLVHHIVYLRNDWSLALSEDNLISVCHQCHEHIHKDDRTVIKKVEKKERNVRVIKG